VQDRNQESSQPNRRDFTKLGAAAVGGLIFGAGCTEKKKADEPKKDDAKKTDKDPKKTDTPAASGSAAAGEWVPFMQEPHVCRGLNACKGKGKGGGNACAGQGACATAAAHTCHTENACKGQGGCGSTPGQNACKGKGECSVPLGDNTWTKARAKFEEVFKKANKPFGAAPAAKAG